MIDHRQTVRWPHVSGYAEERTSYDNVTLRAFNILIETSDAKDPAPNTLGTDQTLWDAGVGDGSGHITRNVRIVFTLVDLVQVRNHPGDANPGRLGMSRDIGRCSDIRMMQLSVLSNHESARPGLAFLV
jgi:hypothetical protein